MSVRLARPVIGIAEPGNHEWLRTYGVIPVSELAINELGVEPFRVDTIVRFDAPE